MDQSSTASSFYEPPEMYDEGKTRDLYEQLKKNFEDVNEALVFIDKDMKNCRKLSLITVALLEKIKTAKEQSTQK